MADSPKDECALHEMQMAFELMGGLEKAAAILGQWSSVFLQRMGVRKAASVADGNTLNW